MYIYAKSNKCKGDHGMGPCVVKRTDLDPDSDGEDETKAAYYADKGKAPRSARGAYSKSDKKRKRSNDNEYNDDYNGDNNHPQLKRPRTSSDPYHGPPQQQIGYYPHPGPEHHGYYAQDGYMTAENGEIPPRPPYHTAMPPPPPIDDFNEGMFVLFLLFIIDCILNNDNTSIQSIHRR